MLSLQERAWETLRAKLERLPHALLLHGPRGVGKRVLAEQFARLALCERQSGPPGRLPCGNCESCRWTEAGTHPDLRFVEPESIGRHSGRDAGEVLSADLPQGQKKPSTEIKIDQVRALQDFVYIGSHRGRRRIVIVHPAEDMNSHAANAMLKSLEEPPAAALFLLVSHRPWRLPPTVRSRCVAIAVQVPDSRASIEWLKSQGVLEPDRWLAYCNGAPELALQTATGDLGELIEAQLRLLAQGALVSAAPATRKEHLEPLVDLLQKYALDKAFLGFGGQSKYGVARAGVSPEDAQAWLGYARDLCRRRLVSRHPLNPGLFAAELVCGLPGTHS